MRHASGPLVTTSGLVDPARAARAFRLVRLPAAPDLAHRVERHWVLSWDLPDGVTHTQEVVPHPAVNLVVEAGGTAFHGIPTGRFARTLRGRGVVVGTKFRPGAFRAYLGAPVATLVGRSVPASALLGDDAHRLGPDLLAGARADPAGAVAQVETVLARHPASGAPDPAADLVARVLRAVLDGSLGAQPTVADLAAHVGTTTRSLQRLVREHVGVTPRWILHRHRVHEAADRIAADPAVDLAALAVELGWWDQAHLTRQFTAVLGTPPAAYARRCASALGAPTAA